MTTIGSNAFRQSGLTTVEIPASVTRIGSHAFFMCKDLQTLTINGYPYLDGNAIDEDYGTVTVKLTAQEVKTGEYWTTFSNDIYNFKADANTEVFKAVRNGSEMTLNKIEDGIVHNRVGVILKSTTPNPVMTLTDSEGSDTQDNNLKYVIYEDGQTSNGKLYALNTGANGLGFYRVPSGTTIGYGKAYFEYDGTEDFISFPTPYEDPGLAWKGKIPEGGFDAYLGFFHPSALPTIKNPNALTGITYSSSNTEVATVDENTGVVTALKAGSTIITATFAGDENYQAASISYTLNIDNPAIVTLPTSTDEGGTVTLVAGAASEAHDGDNKIATNANLEGANTSRNIAVGTDGSIHVVYKHAESGAVMYMKSTDGVTFSEPVQVSAEGGNECEVAVSSNGKVYVSYVANSLGYIAYSADGSSFTSVQVSSGDFYSIHIAADGDYVYGIPQRGYEFYYSADGGQTYATHTGWTEYVFSDVLIDKSNNNVVVIKDDPSVVVRYSTDHGATFTDEQPVMNGANQLAVSFSTAAAGAGKVFISGAEGMIATVNYINATYTQTTIENTENRSLCADEDENVIVGVEQGGSLYYELSTDGAQTFGEKVLVSEGNGANAALNHHDGSLLYLFTKGTDLYLATKTGVVSTETVIDNGDGTYTVMPGTEVTLIAKANDGYHVASWSNSVEVNDPQEATQTITVTGNLNITATFAENEYNITFVEGTNPDPENPEWTATPNPAKTKQTVTVTYSGAKHVKGVKAVKKAEAGKPVATLTAAPTPNGECFPDVNTLNNPGTAEGGTLMYMRTTTNVKPTSTEGFSTDIPTGVDGPSGKNYIWYYIKGDDTHSDSEIFGPIEVNVYLS